MPRFYISPDQWNLEALVLQSEEAHHCRNVLRLAVGDRVTAFNGKGAESSAEITEFNDGEVKLMAISSQKSDPLPTRIGLAQAVPKGKNMDLIVQKATEPGSRSGASLALRAHRNSGECRRSQPQEGKVAPRRLSKPANKAGRTGSPKSQSLSPPPTTSLEISTGTTS